MGSKWLFQSSEIVCTLHASSGLMKHVFSNKETLYTFCVKWDAAILFTKSWCLNVWWLLVSILLGGAVALLCVDVMPTVPTISCWNLLIKYRVPIKTLQQKQMIYIYACHNNCICKQTTCVHTYKYMHMTCNMYTFAIHLYRVCTLYVAICIFQ